MAFFTSLLGLFTVVIFTLFISFKDLKFGYFFFVFTIPFEYSLNFFGYSLSFYVFISLLAVFLYNAFFSKHQFEFINFVLIFVLLWLLWGGLSYVWALNKTLVLGTTLTIFQILLFVLVSVNVLRTHDVITKSILFFSSSLTLLSTYAVIIFPQLSFHGRLILFSDQNPNVAARLIGLALSFLFYLFLISKNLLHRIVFSIMILMNTYAFFLTGSRGAWVAFVGSIFLTLTIYVVKEKVSLKKVLLLSFTTLFVSFSILFSGILPERINNRIIGLMTDGIGTLTGRTDIWEVGFYMVKDNPIQGVGLSNFQTRFLDYAKNIPGYRFNRYISSSRTAHNMYVSTISELGIIGVLVFFSPFVYLVFAIPKRMHGVSFIFSYNLLLYIMISEFTGTNHYRRFFWVAFIISYIMYSIEAKRNSERRQLNHEDYTNH